MSQQTFSFETVACLLAVLESNKIVLGNRHYTLMAKLDGKRTTSGFEHLFRKVKARAKELQYEVRVSRRTASPDSSSEPTSKATPKSSSKPKSAVSKKRNRKGELDEDEAGDDGRKGLVSSSDTPVPKRAKSEPKEEDEEEFFSFVMKENVVDEDGHF